MIENIQDLKSRNIFVVYDRDVHSAVAQDQTDSGIIADIQGPFYSTDVPELRAIVPLNDCFTDLCEAKTALYAQDFKRQQALSEILTKPDDIILFMLSQGFAEHDLLGRVAVLNAFEACFGYPARDRLAEMSEKVKERL